MADGAMEDPFGEYLEQEPASGGYSPTAAPAASPDDAAHQLRLLAESSRRQEQLLGKVCSLLVNLDEKLGAVASNQERLEVKMERMAEDGAFAGGGGGGGGATRRDSGSGRGLIVAPPGKEGGGGGQRPAANSFSGPSKEETARQEAERIAAERSRIEAENARRAEELKRKKIEAEERAKVEAERQRIEDEKRKEEERQRKALLEKKTSGLMGDLVGGGSGGGLFGDDGPSKPRKTKGGLFDDD